ncbi:MAG: exo-alpha-sialidase [Armatimonadetes bacterium]|nr:exo-alpha-sialidase [Armatimonadota bacterium]
MRTEARAVQTRREFIHGSAAALAGACSTMALTAGGSDAEANASGESASFQVQWDPEATVSPGMKAPLQLRTGEVLVWRSVPVQRGGQSIVCYRSRDLGRSWVYLSEIARDNDPATDLGDAHLLQLADGTLLCSYRRNHHPALPPEACRYRIEVACSPDRGATWQPHSIVAEAQGGGRGLWSSFLFEQPDGVLQCYYDDEDSPAQAGFPGHQWLTMRTWDPPTRGWVRPVTVSRAHDPQHLSRDGMCSVVSLAEGRLLCVLESVRTEPPHRGVLRSVTSTDGGVTWSWRDEERRVVCQTRDPRFNALAPSMVRLPGGGLLVAFTTDEDRPQPGVPAEGVLDQSVKCVVSTDEGRTWSAEPMLVDGDSPLYFPGVCLLTAHTRAPVVLAQYLHRHRGSFTRRGRITR